MNPGEHDELVQELLAGEEMSEFRQRSLEAGLLAMRRHRRRRHSLRLGATVCLPVAALLVILLLPSFSERSRRSSPERPQRTAGVAASSASGSSSAISDNHLFALFPGRSMALIGKPGRQRVIFLDGGPPESRAQ